MLRRRCFFATLVGGRCSTVSTLHRVWTHSNVSTLPILFDYSHSVQGVRTGRLRTGTVRKDISSQRKQLIAANGEPYSRPGNEEVERRRGHRSSWIQEKR